MRLKKYCIPLQDRVLSHVHLYWQKQLQEEFDFLMRFLCPTDELAVTYPMTPWSFYRVVIHPNGKIVGIDDDDYDNRLELTKQDIIVRKFDLKMLRREMCGNFGLNPSSEEIGKLIHGVPWGTWEPERGLAFPVTLLFAGCDFRSQVFERILKRKAAGEILITPTRLAWGDGIEEIAREHKVLFVPLDEIVQVEDGRLQPTPEWNEYLTAFCKMVEMDLPSSLLQKPKKNLFAKRGEWLIRFEGKEITLNGKLQGPAFIRQLMLTPNQELHVEQLWKDVLGTGKGIIAHAEEGAGGEWDSFLSSGEETLDTAGKADYQKRLLQLNRDRAEAELENDSAWLERIDAETEAISTRLLKAVDGKGRSRKIGDEKDKLRKRISRNITFFLEKIRLQHSELAGHLDKSLVQGEYMVYQPNEAIEWSFE